MKKLTLFLVSTLILTTGYFLLQNQASTQTGYPDELLKPTGAGSAMDYWYAQRAYPSGKLPTDAYWRAFHSWQADRAGRGENEWTSIGPKNFGGRSLSLAFNPQNANTLWLGTASGGLWRSHSAGRGATAWHYVPTGFPILGVPAVATHPTDSNTIIIGTGEIYNPAAAGTNRVVWQTRGSYGLGLFKTNDGGNSWQQVLNKATADMHGVQTIKYNPVNSAIVFAGCSDGLYRSRDGGSNWNRVFTGTYVSDLAIHPTNTDTMIMALGNYNSSDRGIYRSTDGGTNWTNVTLRGGDYSGKVLLAIAPSQPNRVYASIGYGSPSEIWFSDDFGANWQAKPGIQYTYGWYAHDLAVNPSDPNQLVMGSVNSGRYNATTNQYDTTSYWFTWDFDATTPGGSEGPPYYAHADVHDIQYFPGSNNIVYLVTDGGIFISEDDGWSWGGHNGGLQCQQFYPTCSNSELDSLFYIGGLQDNATAIYEGNEGWRRIIGGDGACTAIDPQDDLHVFAGTQWRNVFVTTIGAQNGNFFRTLRSVSSRTDANFIAPLALCRTNPQVVYTGGDTIFKSTDGGFNWLPAGGGPFDNDRNATTIAISNQDCDVVYVSSSPIAQGNQLGQIISNPPAHMMKTNDGGNTWLNVTGSLPDRIAMDIEIHPTNDDSAYIVLGGYGSSHAYLTTDGGASWIDKGAGLPDVPFNTITMDPKNPLVLFAGCDLGAFVSYDGGTTWSDYSEGLQDATLVMDLSISRVNRKLRMATHGKGVLERDLPEALNTGYPDGLARDLKVFPNPVDQYVTVSFELEKSEEVELSLLGMDGKMIKKLQPANNLQAGKHNIQFDLTGLSTGNYLLEIRNSITVSSKKLIKN